MLSSEIEPFYDRLSSFLIESYEMSLERDRDYL